MKKIATLIALLMLLVVFLGVNIVAGRTLQTARIDLTEGSIYSLSPAGASIARSPDEFVKFTLYASKSLAEDAPTLAARIAFVEEKLQAFSRAGGDKIRLETIDPEPDTEAEDDAAAKGLRPLGTTADGNIYFGLVATNALDGREVIPQFNLRDPNFERFLEFEIAKLIERLGKADKPSIGLITSLPMRGSPPNPMTGDRGQRGYAILNELEAQFDVIDIPESATELPDDLAALMVVHPKAMSPILFYAIDQYLLRGGKSVFFVDPLCEVDFSGLDPSNPMSAMSADRSSQSIPTLDAWGVRVRDGEIALDLGTALELPDQRTGRPVRTLPVLNIDSETTRAATDPVTGGLSGRMIYWFGGVIDSDESPAVNVEWLLRTTTDAATTETQRVAMPGMDMGGLLASFVGGGDNLTLAARLSGEGAPSAYPDGPPEGSAAPNDAHISEAAGSVNAVLIADADITTDRLWIREMNVGGMVLGYQRFSDNGAFVSNLLDAMAGSGDLVALRGRGIAFRPLEKLDEMEREAEAAIASKVAALEERYDEAEQRINEIQRGRSDETDATSLYLTPEQQAELEGLRVARAESRTEIRETRRDLRQGIELLKTRYKLINTVMVPAVLCVLALGLGGYRTVRRRADRRRGGDR